MRRLIICVIIAGLTAFTGCARLKKPKTGQGQVEHRSYTVAFTGYKTSVKVKASPREVDQYILGMTYFNAKTGESRLAITDTRAMHNLGDQVDFKIEVLGIPFPGRFLLVQHKPGEQIWLIAQIQNSIMAILRIDLKQLDDGSRLTLKMELEDTSSLIGQFSQAVNAPEILAGLIEQGMAVGQAHFDPSTSAEQLLARGIRGEYFSAFYQAHDASIWINTPPRKVDRLLHDPNTWESLSRKYGVGVGKCAVMEDSRPCPIQLKLIGLDFDITSYVASHRPEEGTVAFWILSQLIAQMKMLIKPDHGGTRLTFSYAMETPQIMSDQGGSILMNVSEVPGLMEKMLIDAKQAAEGGEKLSRLGVPE